MSKLERKAAVVTAAGRGFSRATALAFTREGTSEADADILEQDKQETARMTMELGGNALAITCDLARNYDVMRGVRRDPQTFWGRDFPFNNANIEYTIKPAAEVTEEEWDRIIDTDFHSVFLCMKHEIPLMLKQA
jgi:NAD(P)-dependent dehydrogenase (short-subunit alcohol dehydrogenase family)